MSNIILSNICKKYGEKVIFDGFNETIPKGKITAIMGQSGIGKTTLINMILRVEPLDDGEITGVPERISAVFQSDCLSEDFSAISNIKAVTGKTVSKETILEMLQNMSLEKADALCPVSTLSGGMKRRVAIARSLLTQSDLIIMDEPFKGIDDETKKIVADIILENISAHGKTLVFITHDESEMALLGADKKIYL